MRIIEYRKVPEVTVCADGGCSGEIVRRFAIKTLKKPCYIDSEGPCTCGSGRNHHYVVKTADH